MHEDRIADGAVRRRQPIASARSAAESRPAPRVAPPCTRQSHPSSSPLLPPPPPTSSSPPPPEPPVPGAPPSLGGSFKRNVALATLPDSSRTQTSTSTLSARSPSGTSSDTTKSSVG